MASVLITFLNIANRLDRQYDYDDGQSELNYILVADITSLSALSSVSTFVLLVRVVLLRLIVFCLFFHYRSQWHSIDQ